MEDFRGPYGAVKALTHWHQSVPGLEFEMSEFVNPEAPTSSASVARREVAPSVAPT